MSLEPNKARNEHTWALTHLFYTHFERKSLFLSLPQTESSFAMSLFAYESETDLNVTKGQFE